MNVKLMILAFLCLPVVGDAAPPTPGLEENCGAVPNTPQWYHRLLSNKNVEAYESHERCLDRNREIQKRNVERQMEDLKNIVFQSHESCRQAIRKIAPRPETLSFDYAKPFSYSSGLNGSAVDMTDGGYSVLVAGTDIQGRFKVKCYMDKHFRVTTTR